MVRLEDVDPQFREHLLNSDLPHFDSTPWVTPAPLPEARVAIISTAGLHRAADPPFVGVSGEYRPIPGDVDFAHLRMSHASVNYDRSAYQRDANVAFPLERLRELAAERAIGSVAAWHYSFMGGAPPERMREAAREVVRLLKGDGVDLALLVPV